MSNIFSSNCKLFSITYHLNSGTQCNMLLQDDMCINFQRNRWTSKSCNWFWILDARTIKSTFESISNWGGLERPWGKPSKGSEVWFLSFAFSTSKLLSLFWRVPLNWGWTTMMEAKFRLQYSQTTALLLQACRKCLRLNSTKSQSTFLFCWANYWVTV